MTSHLLVIPAILVNCWQVFKISHEVVKYIDAGTKDSISFLMPETKENMTRCLQINLDDMKRDNGLFGKALILKAFNMFSLRDWNPDV